MYLIYASTTISDAALFHERNGTRAHCSIEMIELLDHPTQNLFYADRERQSLVQKPRNVLNPALGQEKVRPVTNNGSSGWPEDCLLYVIGLKSGRRFLVDTGAEISVNPAIVLNTHI